MKNGGIQINDVDEDVYEDDDGNGLLRKEGKRDSHHINHQSSSVNSESQEEWFIKLMQESDRSKENHSYSELFIHQLIETIEFVLGTISNTASYLRLWALSLAHGQLAKVFFDKTIGSALESNSIIMLVLMFPVFACITMFVLMFMDVLECFLHDLRLHWVEFQNKFYKGQGYKFVPHSYKRVLFPSEVA